MDGFIDADAVRDEILKSPSTLSPAFLSQVIPDDIKKDAIINFMGEYNGYDYDMMLKEINDDEFYKDVYDGYMSCVTYGDLNTSMCDYLVYFWFDDEYIEGEIKDGSSVDDLKWINDVISSYVIIDGDDVDD